MRQVLLQFMMPRKYAPPAENTFASGSVQCGTVRDAYPSYRAVFQQLRGTREGIIPMSAYLTTQRDGPIITQW